MTTLPSHPFGTKITATDVQDTLASCEGWENRYRALIKWGKLLPSLSDAEKTASVPIPGCESQVWLLCKKNNETFHFSADSDARIVKGLLAVVLAVSEGKKKSQLQDFDYEKYFEQLELLSHLSESRGNGLRAIVNFIKCL
ncbi:cysteine desulfurase sulfur acceptor subunit CsdE [Veronia pacifica]|uniref:Cysteine desulfurase, sulfur acceptor subunit CsdE n=2 Tax=Veronia pacifica TaxID=1080227 RepID=A0A1C3EIA4_9GAMM|nr:cysteine desulfurase, sulfur acceptor subunit CsdE [Veronia pacifica]